ncbi:MAG: beta-lactamase family protein [Acidimicrobiia bacterium]|nr:beta-lactamase family protein [Acidimicrobiia bacterium]
MVRRRWWMAVVVGTALVMSHTACASDEAQPDPVDEDPVPAAMAERLAAELDNLDGLTADDPGCVAGVVEGGQQTVVAHGMADLDAGEPLHAGSVFDLASVAKMLTGAVVVALEEDGVVGRDDLVADWLPELQRVVGDVTVADLLHHSSGLVDYGDLLDDDGIDIDDPATQTDALAAIAAGPPAQLPPGRDFDYSNTNYVLLAEVVAAATGRPFDEVLADEVLEPLGMVDAFLPTTRPVRGEKVVVGYEWDDESDDGWVAVVSPWTQVGDGAVHATVADVLRFATAVVDPADAPGVGGERWAAALVAPGPTPEPSGDGYAAGVVVSDGGAVLGHSGSWLGTSTAMVALPDEGVVAVALCNVDDLDAAAVAEAFLERR